MRRMLFAYCHVPTHAIALVCSEAFAGHFKSAYQHRPQDGVAKRRSNRNINFFRRVVFVQSGLLAQGVINPGTSSPFMLTLSAAHSFGVPTRAIDALDNLPRRYWAVCRCEVLTVAPEIFLRVIEIDPNWNEELNRYALRRAFCERLGLMVCQAAAPEERFGVF